MHYYQHHIGDYRKDTVHLSLLEHGIYRQLLDLYYITEKPLDKQSIRLIGARTEQEIACAELILNEFFDKKGTKYYHKRCDDEIQNYKSKSASAKENANKRWSNIKKLDNANALPTQSERNANQEPITKNQVIKTKIKDDFQVSSYVRDWAIKNKYTQDAIEKHRMYFVVTCKSNSYEKENWDDFFIKAIVDNWAKLPNPKGGVVV